MGLVRLVRGVLFLSVIMYKNAWCLGDMYEWRLVGIIGCTTTQQLSRMARDDLQATRSLFKQQKRPLYYYWSSRMYLSTKWVHTTQSNVCVVNQQSNKTFSFVPGSPIQ